MRKINFEGKNEVKKIHFVGIGGISMSGLAEILLNQGCTVSGSDSHRSAITDRLAEKGAWIYVQHQEENIDSHIDLIVHTAAVAEDNPELAAGRRRGIPVVDRAYLLGLMMKAYQYPLAVAGTHGKTTTTSMLAEIFIAAGLDPTVSVGGVLQSIGGNYRLGNSEYCIVEACEYFDSFLKFYPYLGVVLNIDSDHLDYFGSLENIKKSFNAFAKNIAADGALVIRDMPGLSGITDGVPCRVITFGGEGGQYRAAGISYAGTDEIGLTAFELVENGLALGTVTLHVPGAHNVENALAACAAARTMGVPLHAIIDGLGRFTGAKRRFEVKGQFNGVTVMDDYAHHPTEIRATLSAARRCYSGRVICVFQPHNYSRTKEYLTEFAASFNDADIVVVQDIYSAREKNSSGVHASQLVDLLCQGGKESYYFSSFEETKKFLFDQCVSGDLLITMGAGDVYFLGESMLRTDLSTLSTSIT